MISPRLSTVLAGIITLASVLLAGASLFCVIVVLVLWMPPHAPFPSGWMRWAILWAAGYFVSRIAFWLLTRVPIRHD